MLELSFNSIIMEFNNATLSFNSIKMEFNNTTLSFNSIKTEFNNTTSSFNSMNMQINNTTLNSHVSNVSDNIFTRHEFGLDSSDTWQRFLHLTWKEIVFILVTVILAVIGIVGNALTLLSVFFFKEIRTRYFTILTSLSLSSLLVAVIVPMNIIARQICTFHQFWSTSEWVKSALYTINSLHITSIAAERYLVIKHPINHKAKLSYKRLTILITVIWTIPTIICILPMTIIGMADVHQNDCKFNPVWIIISAGGLFLFLFIFSTVLLVLSIKMVKIYQKHTENITESINSGDSTFHQRRQMRLTVTFISVVVVFLITLVPLAVVRLYEATILYDSMESLKQAWAIADAFALTSPASNFIFYSARIEVFRKAYRKILTGNCHRKLY